MQTIVRGSTWSPPSPSGYNTSPTQPGPAPIPVGHPNRLQPRSDDHSPRYPPSSSPPYRQPPVRSPDFSGPYAPQHPAGPEQPYRGPPSDAAERREYRDLPEFGRNGYRGNGSLPRDLSSLPHPGSNRPTSEQFHPAYATSSRGHPPLQPQYSNGSYNGPAVMESPPRPGMNRPGTENDDRDRLNLQTVSANQQYDRVRLD